jgi:type VI secretion system protein ImpH
MASTHRPARDPLIGRLLADPGDADFHRAVHLLQASVQGSAAVGRQGPIAREAVKFRASLDLAFHNADVSTIEERGDSSFEVTGNFLGLYGTVSPLPAYYTENLLHNDESALERGFIDIFHHRLYSLFHRCWERMRIDLEYRGDGSDSFSRKLLGLAGLRYQDLAADRLTSPGRLLALAGPLSREARSVSQIEAVVKAWFPDVPIEIEPCLGSWLAIPNDQQNRLGRANCRLGQDFSLGNLVFDRACSFGVSIGPVPLETCLRFLPSGDLMGELREVIDELNVDALDYRVDLHIIPAEVPRLCLEGLFSSDQTRLGWTTWLGERPEHTEPISFLISDWIHHG